MKKSRHHYVFVIDFLHLSCSAKLRARAREQERKSQMPKNATIQIKTLTPRQAINRTNENLRLGEKFKETKNVIVLKNNLASTSFSTEKKERSKDDAEIGKKINALRSSIKTYEKRISQTTDEKKIAKMQNKILGYEDEIQNLETKKSGNETRGRKKEKQFVEFIFSLTNTPPNGVDKNYIENFNQAIKKYIAKYFGKSSQLVTIATHLDQHSLHAHAIIKLPKGKTWTELILKKTQQKVEFTDEQIKERSSKPIYDALKKGYEIIARHFQDFMSQELNIKFDELKSGVFYKSLSKYKKETGFNSDFKALEAQKIKKETFESTNEAKTVKNDSSSFYDDIEASSKRFKAIMAETKQAEQEQPRSTELPHDDEAGSSHGDVPKAKRRRARR